MRTLLEKLEATLAAVAFAEEGDVETARQMVRAGARREKPPLDR